MNCYENLISEDKELLRINLDETSVRTYNAPRPGLVSLSPKRRKARRAGIDVHPAGREKQRACLRHVVFVADNSEVQAALPHFFLAMKRFYHYTSCKESLLDCTLMFDFGGG